jgi:hypothetical protein
MPVFLGDIHACGLYSPMSPPTAAAGAMQTWVQAGTGVFQVFRTPIHDLTPIKKNLAAAINTGRTLPLFEEAARHKAHCLPRADALIAGVGTRVYFAGQGGQAGAYFASQTKSRARTAE